MTIADNLQRPRPFVRLATCSDILGIRDTLERARALSDKKYPAPDYPYALQVILDQIAVHMVAVATSPRGEVVGCIILARRHFAWTHPENPRGWFLQNDHFWVEPGYRRGGTAKGLLNWAKERAAQDRLPLEIDMATLDENVHYKDRFVANQGFVYQGGKFVFTAPPSSSPVKEAPAPVQAEPAIEDAPA